MYFPINKDREYEDILVEELKKPMLILLKESPDMLRDVDVNKI